MSELIWHRYGKSHIRLVKVDRSAPEDRLIDLTIDVQLQGAFERVYTRGDNTRCLPTDTMKNTVYALARQHRFDDVEHFAILVTDHFARQPGVSTVEIAIVEQPWARLSAGGRPHPHAFMPAGSEQWTCAATGNANAIRVASGLTNLVLLKTADSAFAGFYRDRFTTLADTRDRLLATSLTARWTHRPQPGAFACRETIRAALVETFAAHKSESVQHTLHAMGEAALAASSDISDITLTLPNRHHLLVDLGPFGLDNPNEIFVATEQPFGVIEATLSREGGVQDP